MSGEGNDLWFTKREQQCIDCLESEPDYDQVLTEENANFQRRIWTTFQDSATAVAQLYRERNCKEPGAVWLYFQSAAGTLTHIYKESCESYKKMTELAKQGGYQKRNRELLHWAKRKHQRFIRREDLIAYLAGKPPVSRQYHHHNHSHRIHTTSHRDSTVVTTTPHLMDPNLHTFRDALANSRNGTSYRGSSTRTTDSDLCSFIAGEMARHGVKRSASPNDVIMGSPSHQKKPRL